MVSRATSSAIVQGWATMIAALRVHVTDQSGSHVDKLIWYPIFSRTLDIQCPPTYKVCYSSALSLLRTNKGSARLIIMFKLSIIPITTMVVLGSQKTEFGQFPTFEW